MRGTRLRRFLRAGILLLLSAGVIAAARAFPDFWFSFYTDFSRNVLSFLAMITAPAPFILWQPGLIVLILAALVLLGISLKKRLFLDWLSWVLEVCALLFFLIVGLWGLNHFGPEIGEQIGLDVGQYTKSQLAEATRYYAGKASEASLQVERDEAGDPVFPQFSQMGQTAVENYRILAASQPRFSGCGTAVKPLFFSKAYGYMGITGVYLCLTAEPGVSTETYIVSQPYIMCHELAHGMAVAAEDEANYCAFLACEASRSEEFRYSGYYNAYVYCSNALYEIDKDAAMDIAAQCSDELNHDAHVHVVHNSQYDGAVQDAAQAVNDGYLKAFGEEGTRSYGLVADYLIAHYFALKDAGAI